VRRSRTGAEGLLDGKPVSKNKLEQFEFDFSPVQTVSGDSPQKQAAAYRQASDEMYAKHGFVFEDAGISKQDWRRKERLGY
jgi:hypothetical protein